MGMVGGQRSEATEQNPAPPPVPSNPEGFYYDRELLEHFNCGAKLHRERGERQRDGRRVRSAVGAGVKKITENKSRKTPRLSFGERMGCFMSREVIVKMNFRAGLIVGGRKNTCKTLVKYYHSEKIYQIKHDCTASILMLFQESYELKR